jgi:RimJ/RimL family protein N-acetyltransferase
MAHPVTIRTARLTLREKRLEDAEDDFAWRTDPELARYDAVTPMRMGYPDYLRLYRGDLRNPPQRLLVLGVDNEAGEHIGNCMCYDIDVESGEGELGIMLGRKDSWGQGYGTETIKAFLPYVFQRYNLNRIYLHTLDWNHRAQRAFEKAGFHVIGPVARNGYSFIKMEVLRAEVPAGLEAAASLERPSA